MSTQDSGNSQPSFPSLCKNGCGFFGGIENRGYCSVCFKEILKKEEADKSENNEKSETAEALAQLTLEEKSDSLHQEEPKAEAVAEVITKVEDELPQTTTDGATAAPAVADAEKEKEEQKDTKKKKNRCFVCKKKLGLTGFSCRCGGLFCGIHRYTDKHECNFDYKAMGEKEISEANPVIVAQKLNKI